LVEFVHAPDHDRKIPRRCSLLEYAAGPEGPIGGAQQALDDPLRVLVVIGDDTPNGFAWTDPQITDWIRKRDVACLA